MKRTVVVILTVLAVLFIVHGVKVLLSRSNPPESCYITGCTFNYLWGWQQS